MVHINVGCPPSKTIVIRNCTVPSGEGPVPYLTQVNPVMRDKNFVNKVEKLDSSARLIEDTVLCTCPHD